MLLFSLVVHIFVEPIILPITLLQFIKKEHSVRDTFDIMVDFFPENLFQDISEFCGDLFTWESVRAGPQFSDILQAYETYSFF